MKDNELTTYDDLWENADCDRCGNPATVTIIDPNRTIPVSRLNKCAKQDEFTDDCCRDECFIWPNGKINHCAYHCAKTTEKRICRWCSEWIEVSRLGVWRHVGGEVRCETEAEPMLTIREHAGLDPIPGDVPEPG